MINFRRKSRRRSSKSDSEAANCRALIQWARIKARTTDPDLWLLYHIANEGTGSARRGAELKAQGVLAGVPDYCLPVPRGRYHGLYIEMKAKTGRVSLSQQAVGAALITLGYAVQVCYGWEEAKDTILEYLALPIPLRET